MNIIRATTRLALFRVGPSAPFSSGNNWKERDEAAEKVYISQRESTPAVILEDALKKLLQKVEN